MVLRWITIPPLRPCELFWGSTPLEDCPQQPLHSIKCTAWVAISKHGIIRPYWFEDENEWSLMVLLSVLHSKCYRRLGQRRGWSMVSAWLCYHSHFKLNLQWLISWRCEIKWVPHLPDLNLPDFLYLWGYLKDNVYENNHQTISEIKRATTRRIKRISLKECVWVIDSFANHIHVCLQHPGVHLEYILERHDSKTMWNLCLKFCAKFVHKKKFINNKFFFCLLQHCYFY